MPIDENILQRLRANDTGLTSLNLNKCSLTDADIQILANALENNTILTRLYLKENEISDEGAKVLAKNSALIALNLERNKIKD